MAMFCEKLLQLITTNVTPESHSSCNEITVGFTQVILMTMHQRVTKIRSKIACINYPFTQARILLAACVAYLSLSALRVLDALYSWREDLPAVCFPVLL